MIYHTPVLLNSVLDFLVSDKEGVYVDCTMGEGGHTLGILNKISPMGSLISLDQDIQMIEKAKIRFSSWKNWRCIHSNFRDIHLTLKHLKIDQVDGILADLGLSMFHYKVSDKGFSFAKDDPLDMSLASSHLNASVIVNTYSAEEIQSLLWTYGEESHARRIAHFIVYYRENVRSIQTTRELADIVYKALNSLPYYKATKIHPATKTFQAIRIAVNQELDSLCILLEESLKLLKPKGSMVFLTYHSLEDRIVKEFIIKHKEKFSDFTKKPMIPSKEEIKNNKAARSAKLRFFKI